MIYIFIIIAIIILLLCVVFYSQSDIEPPTIIEVGEEVEGFSNYGSIRNIILKNNNLLSNNIGVLNYDGSIFERNNKHNFVFRKINGKLQNFGDNLDNFPTNNVSNKAKLFQNHDSYCIIDNKKVICFGDRNNGGEIPDNIKSMLDNDNKQVTSIFSTDKAFCALTSDKNIYCWGSSDHGGVIPTTVNNLLKNNVSKIFSNKDSFIAVYTNQKKVRVWGGIEMPNSLLTLKNVKNVFSNNNTFIILYEEIEGSDRKQKITCFASSPKYILNKNNVEKLENVKTIYSNSESFIVIYGDDNKLDVCGNNKFLGELMNEKDNIKDIVHVVTNIGAYCLLDSEGTIHVFGHKKFIKNLPEEKNRKNIKKLYANHGAFIAVNNDDTAFVFGLESHGYVSNNNIILNVKDVYVNGDENGGAILFIKKGNENILCLGHGDYGGNTILLISSSSVKEVFSNTFVFYYRNSNNELKAIGDISNIGNYNSKTKYIKDNSNIYSNNHILSKYNNISDFDKIINYDVDSIPTSPTSPSTSQASQTTASKSFEDNDINYYIWKFENSKDNITNTDESWDIDTQDLNYTMHNSIMTKLDKDYPVIKFKDKTFEGDTYSISFNFKIDNIDKKFIVFSMLNIKLIYDDKKLKLLYKDTNVRNVNIDDSEIIITLTFTKNEIKIYKNTSEITYSNNVNYSLDSNSTEYKLEFGNTQGDEFDNANFNISNLIIIENYKLNNQNVSAINADLTTFINEFNLLNTTTQASTTAVNNQNEQNEESTTSSLSNTNQVKVKDVDLITKSAFEIQNFLIISPQFQNSPLKLKIKSSENISFIKGQTDVNFTKLTNFKNKIKSESVSLYVKSNFNISKVDEITYRGLVFNKKSYSSEIDGKMYYIFELNNEALLKIINLKYLDIEQINRIYSQNGRYGSVYIMILGTKTLPSNPIFQIKDNVYIIVFVDKDNIYRYEQVRVDLNYFYNIFNFEFMKLYINEDLPKEINNNLVTAFYENLQDNVTKNYDNIVFNENDNILKSIVVNVFKNKNRSDVINVFNNIQKQNNKCTFNPSGSTLFECRQLCSNDLNLSCSETQCNNICNNCNTEACKWNFTKKFNERKLRPDRSNIKGFQGNKFIKVTWIKPQSKSEIIKYYIVITTPTNKEFIQIYSFYDTRELPEYIVKDLENGIPYSVSVISKNKIGVSDVSNIETVVPSEHSELDDYEQKNTYDNSLQNYYKESSDGIDISVQKSIYEKQVIINELKDILVNKLKIDKPLGVYTVNIF